MKFEVGKKYRNKHQTDVDFLVMEIRTNMCRGSCLRGEWINRKNPKIFHAFDEVFIKIEHYDDWEEISEKPETL